MKRLLLALALGGAALPALTLATDVGVSISIGDPNFYGRIDIGDFPQPRLIFPQPILIGRVAVVREPLYLRVPPGHAKDWGKHCSHYDACGRRVFFVEDNWYNDVYAPRYRERHGKPGQAKHQGDDDHGKGDQGDKKNKHKK